MIDAQALAASPELSPRRQWVALSALVLPVLLISMDNTILGFAVPRLSRSIEPTSSQLLWIIDVYSFVLAGLLVTMGSLGDRIGRRRLLLIGSAGFGAASIAAAFSTSPLMLIGARAALGVAGATLLPSTLSLIRNIFPDARRRQTAIAIWASVFSVGSAFGPLIGGALLEHFWWGSVFLAGVPVAFALVLVGPLVIPESKDPDPGAFDALSSVLSISAMLPVVYGIKRFAEDGPAVDAFLGLLLGVAAGWAFVRRQRTSAAPMIDVTLFRLPRFRVAISGNIVACFGFAGSLFLVTQYLQIVVGMSPIRAGLQLLPAIAASMLSSLRSPWLSHRFGAFAVIAAGLISGGIGFLLLSQIDTATPVALATVAVVLINGGFSMALTVAVDGILASVPAEKAGAGASVSETGNELGFALGTALLGSLVTVIYRRRFVGLDQFSPATIDEARQTLGGAEQAAERLSAPLGEALRSISHHAYMDGVRVACLVAAALVLLTAIGAARTARTDTTRRMPPAVEEA